LAQWLKHSFAKGETQFFKKLYSQFPR
jgi:hypothetical protein